MAVAAPTLVNPTEATLELVTPDPAEQAKLTLIDGLAFDGFGNLLGVLEVTFPLGSVVYIDKGTGAVTKLISEINRADQIALHPSGDFYVTSEAPSSTIDRIYRVEVGYDASDSMMG